MYLSEVIAHEDQNVCKRKRSDSSRRSKMYLSEVIAHEDQKCI